MSGNIVELAQRFVRLSSELDATRDAMRRLLLNGAGPNENPTPTRRPGAKGPAIKSPKGGRGGSGRRDDPRTVAIVAGTTNEIAKATAAQGSTADERLKRLQAKGLIERDDASAGWRARADRRGDRRFARALLIAAMRALDQTARGLRLAAACKE
jgi:hypothetical protein